MSRNHLLLRPSLLALATAASLFSIPALAQDAAGAGAGPVDPQVAASGDIVVTAQRREESLRTVPQSITALSSAGLATHGVVSLNDLGRQTPGLTMTERANHIPNVTLRGIGSFGFVKGVGFYIDDVPNFTDQTMRLEDLDRVEIVKGPQGTLFGGNAVGGAIRYISKKPSFEISGEAKAEFGNREYDNAYGSLNLPISRDVAALRVSGYYNHDNGFIDDDNLHVPIAQDREYGARAQLLLKPAANFTALLTARYRDFDGGAFAYALQNSVNTPSYHSTLTFPPEYHAKTWSGTAELTYDFEKASLTSITSYTRQTIFTHLDNDYKPAATVSSQSQATPTKVLTQELRLTSHSDGRFDWIVGLFADRLDNVALNPSPVAITIAGTVFSPYNDYTTRQTDYAAFATGNLHFGDFTLSAGARLNRTNYVATTHVVTRVVDNEVVSNPDTALLPKLTVSWKAGQGTLLYASVAKGYESGKVDLDLAPVKTYAPETNVTYEVGAKGTLANSAVYYEISGFYIDSHNRQAEIFSVDSSGVGSKRVRSVGDATSKGVEASLSWRPVAGLTLDGAVGYLDAKWDTGTSNGIALKGKQVPNAPAWTANIGASYSTPVSDALKLDLHADAAYKDSFEWTLNYPAFSNTNPSYWLAAARVALGSINGRWQVAAHVDNLFDKKYFTEFIPNYAGPQAADGTCVQCHLGALGGRRRLVFSLDTKF